MTAGLRRSTLAMLTAGVLNTLAGALGAQEAEPAALAVPLQKTTLTLEDGLKTAAHEGTPISGKFEIEDNALQLSVYTLMGSELIKVVIDPKRGSSAKVEGITDAADIAEARAEEAAMARARRSLREAAEAATKANAGARAIAINPQLRNGRPIAVVTLLHGIAMFRKVIEQLD